MKKLIYSFITIIIISFTITNLNSSPGGYTGVLNSSSGCSCHNANPNNAITLTHSGNTTVTAGTTVSWSVTVTRSAATKSGCDFGVKDASGNTVGTVSTTASGLKVSSSEITQSSTRTMSGGSYTYNFSWTAPSTAGTYYLKGMATAGTGNKNDWNSMTPVTITVNPPPGTISITKPVTAESWCQNSNQTITWNYSNITNVKIELSSDGGTTFNTLVTASTPADAKTYSYYVPSSLIAGTQYRARVSDASNSNVKSVSPTNFTVRALTEITSQPVNKVVCENQPATFSVAATGTSLNYVWRHNSNPILDAPNNNTYTIPNVTQANTGSYDVQITGACGMVVTSTTATLTVNKPIVVLAQPESQVICRNSKLDLKFSATGTGLKFQWKKNGTNINGKTDSVLSFAAIAYSDSGAYTCEITGACSSIPIVSNTATINVIGAPAFTLQPVGKTATEGDSVSITTNAIGYNLVYTWKKNGVAITPAVNSPTLTFKKVALVDAGDYSCTVSNQCQSINSAIAKLVVNKTSSEPVLNLSTQEIKTDTVKLLQKASTTFKSLISNGGDKDLTITNLAISGVDASNFTIKNLVLPLTIKKGTALDLEIELNGTTEGIKNAKITFTSNSAINPELALSGFVINPLIQADILKVTFNKVYIGSDTTNSIMISNKGNANLDLTAELSGTNFDQFYVSSNIVSTKTNNSTELKIGCKPSTTGNHSAKLTLKNKWIEDILIDITSNSISDVIDFDNNNEITIYPNPVKESLYIKSDLSINKIEILNLLGISQQTIDMTNQNQIPLNLNNGLYIVKFYSENRILTKKLIINK